MRQKQCQHCFLLESEAKGETDCIGSSKGHEWKELPDLRLQALIDERGLVYGDPYLSHVNIGLAWTGLIQQHYGITLSHSLPASLVAQMMVAFKNQRSARIYKQDNDDDLRVYQGFAVEFQQREGRVLVNVNPYGPTSQATGEAEKK